MSAWFENFMVESLEPIHDWVDVYDFMWFGGDGVERSDKEFRRVAENALANLDRLQAAGFEEWIMDLGHDRLEPVAAAQAIQRWKEQLEAALETDDFDAMLDDLRRHGPFLLATTHHPRRPTPPTVDSNTPAT